MSVFIIDLNHFDEEDPVPLFLSDFWIGILTLMFKCLVAPSPQPPTAGFPLIIMTG